MLSRGSFRVGLHWLVIGALAFCLMPSLGLFAQEGGGFTRIGGSPGGAVTATGPEGENTNQAVGQAEVEVALELEGREQAEIGRYYVLNVIAHNNSPSTASNVRVRISVTLKAPDGTVIDTSGMVRYTGSRPVRCAQSESDRVCPFGDIPSGRSRSVEVRSELGSTVPAGELGFSAELRADSQIEAGSIVSDRKVVALVPSAQPQTEVDLHLTVERELDVVQPGMRFGHVIKIRNASDRHEATQVELQVHQRMVAREGNRFNLFNEAFRSSMIGNDEFCTRNNHSHRCRFPTIQPGEEVRVAVELGVVEELAPGRLGRVETQARVRSAENDPNRADNLAREYTNVVSGLPEIHFFGRVRDDRGELGIRPTRTLTHGQQFGIAARFIDVPGGGPSGEEIPVRLIVDGGDTIAMSLRRGRAEDDSYRVFKSPVFRLLAPVTRPPPEVDDSRVVYAGAGPNLRLVYGAEGAPQVEIMASVRAREARRTAPDDQQR